MPTRLNPYISFQDTARDAMEFYRSVFGGELTMNTFGQYGDQGPAADRIMHASLLTGSGLALMAADTPEGMEYRPGRNVAMSLSGEDEAELRGYWDKLSEGGTVEVPLEKQVWGDTFGSCVDRFGISWMVNIAGTPQG